MNIKQLLDSKEFTDKYILKLILQDLFDFTKEQLYLNWNKEIGIEQFKKIKEIYKKYEQDNIPIEYLLGWAIFMGEKFIVNENTLIPRPETEYLIKYVLEEIKNNLEGNQMINSDEIRGKNVSSHPELVSGSKFSGGDAEINSAGQKMSSEFQKNNISSEIPFIFDIGTGSGIIGIMLNKLTKLPTICSDVSKEALKVAKKNNQRLNKNNKNIKFLISNLAEHLKQIENLEWIINNGKELNHSELALGSKFSGGDAEINSAGQKMSSEFQKNNILSGNHLIKSSEIPFIFDIGTGSGIIGIMLNKLTKIPTICSDVSKEALEVAKKNNQRLNKNSKNIKFLISNLAEHLKYNDELGIINDKLEGNHSELALESKFSGGDAEINSAGQKMSSEFQKNNISSGNHLLKSSEIPFIICANLPYVEENFQLDEYAKKEPETALFAGQDGLDLYRELLDQVVKMKNKKIVLFFELMTKQAEALISEYKDFNFEILDTFHHNIKILKIYKAK